MSDSSESFQPAEDSSPAKRGGMAGLIDWLKSVDKWWTVLLLLFCVTGVLGLPVLWISRSYGIAGKIVLSILVTIYTAFLFWLVYLVIIFAYNAVVEAGS